ncbi:TIP30-like protein [Aphelenchoides avenae]|nr:TIP30-like protein [Aphelenchus avenae]
MAFVVGHTSRTGKVLVSELLKRNVFRKLILIGRREVPLEGELYQNVEQRVIDFDNVAAHKEAFKNCTVGFCCLGSAPGSPDGFAKVDHDYVVGVAKAAREQGTQHFSVLSAWSADKSNVVFNTLFDNYPKTKALMERDVIALDFPRTTIFRPGFFECESSDDARLWERMVLGILTPVRWLSPTSVSVSTSAVARAMVADLWREATNKVDFIDNATVHKMANELLG